MTCGIALDIGKNPDRIIVETIEFGRYRDIYQTIILLDTILFSLPLFESYLRMPA